MVKRVEQIQSKKLCGIVVEAVPPKSALASSAV